MSTPNTPDNPDDEAPPVSAPIGVTATTAPPIPQAQHIADLNVASATKLLEEPRAAIECRVCADPAIWRAQAFDAYANVRDELNRIAGPLPSALPPASCEPTERERIVVNVDTALGEALNAMAPDCDRSWWQPQWWLRLRLFYSGSQIEQAWLAIHRARAELYLLYTADELNAQTEALGVLLTDLPETSTLRGSLTTGLTHLGATIGETTDVPKGEQGKGGQPNKESEKGKGSEKGGKGAETKQGNAIKSGAPTQQGGDTPKAEPTATPSVDTKSKRGVSSELQRIYEHAIGVSDRLQREARVLRNNMMVASLGIFIVVAALGLAHFFEPKIVSLCAAKVCPLGASPKPLDVFVVELAGVLGGLLSVVIPLAGGERIQTPYRVFNQQLLLKTLAGAASAVGGVLLVGGELVSLVQFKTSGALLAYAVVFGFAQQIVTGAVDRRASALAKETPSVKGV